MLGIASPAAAGDRDGDGIDDAEDNCTAKANGPLPPGPDQERVLQRDTDLDGFGNVCDADFNNDGVKGIRDYLMWRAAWDSSMGDPDYSPEVDMNGDGVVGTADYRLWAQQPWGGPPGPSGLACAGATTPCPAQNILILIADDVGVDNVGAYGVDPNAPETPAIDALAAAGVRFTNAWGNPVCSTTRATALTGLFGFRTGMGAGVAGGNPDAFRLDPAHPSIARSLKAKGYQTAAFGKWHLSTYCTRAGACDGTVFDIDHPLEMGFDYYEGPLGNLHIDYCSWPKVELLRHPDGTVGVLQNGASTTYAPTDTLQAAISRIGVMGEPWLAWVGFNLAHGPLHTAPPYDPGDPDPCPVSAGPDRARMYDSMVERLDDDIGVLLAAIPADVRSRTTVILFGDNGTTPYAVTPPFDPSRAKETVYQGGVNVPFIAKGRTVTAPPGGATSAALVSTTDLFATVAGVAGFALPSVLDSVSFASHLSDAGLPSTRSSSYAEIFTPNGFGARTRFEGAIRDGRHKLIRFEGERFEGYDLLAAPYPSESSDLIPAPTRAQRDALFCLAEEMKDLLGEPWTYDDFDGDSVANPADNCSAVPNPSQCNLEGSPADAFGNHCDGDFDNDGDVDGTDYSAFLTHLRARSGDPEFDMNCDGSIDGADQSALIERLGRAPGPRGCGGGIPCAGTAPHDCRREGRRSSSAGRLRMRLPAP